MKKRTFVPYRDMSPGSWFSDDFLWIYEQFRKHGAMTYILPSGDRVRRYGDGWVVR